MMNNESLHLDNKSIKPLRPIDGIDVLLWFLKVLIWFIIGLVLFGVFYVLLLSAIAGPEDFAFTVVRLAIFVITIVFALVLLNIGYRINTDFYEKKQHEECDESTEALNTFIKSPDMSDLAVLKPFMYKLDIVELSSKSFPENDLFHIKKAFIKLGADFSLEKLARHSRRKWIQLQSILLLGWLQSPERLSVLNDGLFDPDAGISFAAGEALANYDSDVAYSILLYSLDEGRLTRSRMAAILESSKYKDVLPILSKQVSNPRSEVRFWIAYLLGRSDNIDALPILYGMANDENPDVRASAAEAIGHFGENEKTVKALKKLIKDDHWPVRIHAAKTIGDLKLVGMIDSLTPLLSDSEWWVRQNSSIALIKIGEPTIPYMEKLIRSDDRFVRNKAAEILGRFGVISANLQNLDKKGREGKKAKEMLLLVGRAEAFHIIEEEILQAKPEVQNKVIDIMQEIGDETTLPVLEELTEGQSQSVKDHALQAIEEVKGVEAA